MRIHHRHVTRSELRTLWRRPLLALVSLPIAAGMVVPVWAAPAAPAAAASTSGVIKAIGTENEYADVLSQIGGKYVQVSSILNNPNTIPMNRGTLDRERTRLKS